MSELTNTPIGSMLVIDDEASICFALERYFSKRGWAVTTVASGTEGVELYRQSPFDVVFLDVRLPDGNGLERLPELRNINPEACVIVITAFGDLDTVVRAAERDAFEYLAKPLDLLQVEELLGQIVAMREEGGKIETSDEDRAKVAQHAIVGASLAMQEIYKRIAHLAKNENTVLITGETGTGKELVARAIHHYSNRREGPFIAVNCGALPEGLVESELFGHVRGAFTDAHSDRKGVFEAADGGTLLLDEVGELTPNAQVKLLRVLDNRTVERIGSVKSIPLDVRIITATNRNLLTEVRQRRFRDDLYYRLAVETVALPALRERMEDLELLIEHFLRIGSQESGRASKHVVKHIDAAAMERLQNHRFDGNVRELKNSILQAISTARGQTITADDLRLLSQDGPSASASHAVIDDPLDAYLESILSQGGDLLYSKAVEPVENELIRRVMEECDGNQSLAAKRLGLHRNTLRKKLRIHDPG
ncbi:MAG: sigma-54 dependent transcriptional regulator [Planctomycetia bacterium]